MKGRWTNTRLALADHYADRYAAACWNTHGSGATGVRYVSEAFVPAIPAQDLVDARRFAILVAEMCLRAVRGWDDSLEIKFAIENKTHVERSHQALFGECS